MTYPEWPFFYDIPNAPISVIFVAWMSYKYASSWLVDGIYNPMKYLRDKNCTKDKRYIHGNN